MVSSYPEKKGNKQRRFRVEEFSWWNALLALIGVLGLMVCIHIIDKVTPKHKDEDEK